MNLEKLKDWLPNKTIDELKHIKEIVEEEINHANQKGNSLICPNCKEPLDFQSTIKHDDDTYDKWICEDCKHIIVLDWRGEDNLIKTDKEKIKDYARAILKADRQDYDGSSDDIIDTARILSQTILGD